jgi:hypothetical protein
MTLIYELVGRFFVRLFWWRFHREVKIAGAVALAAVVAGGWILSRREPPEG